MNSDESTKIKAMYSRSGHKGQPGYGLPLTTLFWLWPIPIFFTRNQLVIASINVTSTDHSQTLANRPLRDLREAADGYRWRMAA